MQGLCAYVANEFTPSLGKWLEVIPLFFNAHRLLRITLRLQRWRWWRQVTKAAFVVQKFKYAMMINPPGYNLDYRIEKIGPR